MTLELIATLIQTGINLYKVYCEECKEDVEVNSLNIDGKIIGNCPYCKHTIEAKIE